MMYAKVLCCLPIGIFVPLSFAIIVRSAVQAMASNPEAKGINTLAIVGMGFCESIAILAIVFMSIL